MSRTSCISHAAGQQLVIIRQDYLALAEGNHCAAALLNIFEYWTSVKLAEREQKQIENEIAKEGGADLLDESLWIYKRITDLQEELLGLFGVSKISKALDWLESKGIIESRNNPKYGWDRTLQYLFHYELVQSLLLTIGSVKNNGSKRSKVTIGKRKNNDAIPKTTSETTTQTTSENKDLALGSAGMTTPATSSGSEGSSGAAIGKDGLTADPSIKETTNGATQDKTPPISAPPPPSEHEIIVGLIDAWINSAEVIQPSAYGNKTIRNQALEMHKRGVTPEYIRQYIQFKREDPFWKTKEIDWAKVAGEILPFMKFKGLIPTANSATDYIEPVYILTPEEARNLETEARRLREQGRAQTPGGFPR